MAVKQIRNHGKKVWMARVAYRDRRRASFCDSKEAARQAEADLLKQLKAEAGQAEAEGQRPATLRQLFEYYAEDLEARGKGPDTIGRAAETAKAVERLMPELLEHQVGRIGDREIFAFRNLRAREGSVVRELVAGVKVERRADRDGARRLEDGADDAAVRGGHRCDVESGRGGREWQRTMAADQ